MRPPGLREHDNDKVSFRDVHIVPSQSEIMCEEQPYLPGLENEGQHNTEVILVCFTKAACFQKK